MMSIYFEQQLSNIWGSIHEKLKLRPSWKKALLIKKRVYAYLLAEYVQSLVLIDVSFLNKTLSFLLLD